MAVSQSQKIAVQKYRAKTYDTIGFDVPKGKREEFKAAAGELGLSLAKFLFLAAEDYGKKHNGEKLATVEKPESDKLTAADRELVEEFNQLPADTQKALAKLIQTINATKRAD